MTQTGASVGESVGVTSAGQPLRLRIVGTTSLFAPLDPAKPFLVADLPTSTRAVRRLGPDAPGETSGG